jgi:hypothetical protein
MNSFKSRRKNRLTYLQQYFDLNKPLGDFYICSSHNTYLPGNQLSDRSAYHMYFAFLNKFKGGCLEIDPIKVTKDRSDIIINHANIQLTGGIKLGNLLYQIKLWLLRNIDHVTGPIILTFDNKSVKSIKDHQVIWKVFNEVLFTKENLDLGLTMSYDEVVKIDTPIRDLIGKIILRWDEQKINTDVKALIRPDTDAKTWIHINKPHVKLLSEAYQPENDRLSMQTFKNNMKVFTKIHPNLEAGKNRLTLKRLYPDPLKILSGNYNPDIYIQNGINCVALNFQHYDHYLEAYTTFFGSFCLKSKMGQSSERFNIQMIADKLVEYYDGPSNKFIKLADQPISVSKLFPIVVLRYNKKMKGVHIGYDQKKISLFGKNKKVICFEKTFNLNSVANCNKLLTGKTNNREINYTDKHILDQHFDQYLTYAELHSNDEKTREDINISYSWV